MKEQADSDSGVVGTHWKRLKSRYVVAVILLHDRHEDRQNYDSRFKSGLSLFAVTSERNYE